MSGSTTTDVVTTDVVTTEVIARRAAPRQPAVPGRAVPASASAALIVVTFLLVTVHTAPFADLTSVANIEVRAGGNLATQVAYSLLLVAAAAVLHRIGLERLRPLATPTYLLLTGWIAVSTILAQAPLTAGRRLILTFICVLLAAVLLLAARSVGHFARVLALTALCVLVLSYLSLVLAPTYAMHTILDLREPHLAGDWRGPFNHKNEAGAIMVLFVLVGLLAHATGRRLLGTGVVALAATFLLFTHSKTALVLLPLVLVQARLARTFTGTLPRLVVLLGPVAGLALVSLGSLFLAPVERAVAGLVPDPTFTGRRAIWEFTVQNILQHPITGWGYGGFWRTEHTQYASWGVQSWLAQTDQAHNAYLDTALFMGLPGLALTLLAFVLLPLRDLQNAAGGRGMDPATGFFVSLWLYGLNTAFFESILYEGNSAIFLFFVLGIFGLRFRTLARPVRA